MAMNSYILFFISLPEAFLNLVIFLLFAGAKEYLKVNRPNVIRFAISLAAMLVLTYIINPYISNAIVKMLIHCIVYIMIIMLTYRMKLSFAALSVLFTLLMFSAIENSYFPFVIAYISKGIENFLKNYHLFVIYSIPTRILQIVIILYLWKHEILLVTKVNRQFHKSFIALSILFPCVGYFLNYIFYTYFTLLPLFQQILFALVIVILAVSFNYLMYQIIYVALGRIITNGYARYKELEENAKLALDIIGDLIKENRNNEALELIEDLRGSKNNQNGR